MDCPPHFWGGWVGYVGYDAAWLFENLPDRSKKRLNIPDIYFMQVERLAVYDHKTGILKYIVSPEMANYDHLAGEIHDVWKRIHSADLQSETNVRLPREHTATSLKSNTTKSGYMDMVKRVKRYIANGDIYQANIAQQFEMDFMGDPFQLYLQLRDINPSPFSGYLKFADLALVSSSPERLLKLDEKLLETRPIAGTRPRGKTPDEDRQLTQDLLLNEKEKAEHLMLVDLERNDLGRICEYGSVRVSDLMFVEKYSHVTHIVSNILGTLAPDVTILDILQAVFPGGTITGCPKIRCMEIIDELEPSCRGPYSGSFGYIGWSKYMDLNIIIRTIIVKNHKACFHVGAGIVADSDPENEYNETLAKAAAMIEVLGGH
ncbi:MAG: aminodeoxychorismate synthase, component I [Nitrospinae bacterium RIFCSPLOWO2_12_FULL_47_7]|nr:MAG: aminodeoxychorismate synthase, component I [Nitrospinae bacterium RIFCSPLOWO2_12_FULL_47_7]